MKTIKYLLSVELRVVLLLCFAIACQNQSVKSPTDATATDAKTSEAETAKKIVSLSGTITETLFALGHGDQIIGVDVTSTYPASVKDLPQLGHISRLNVEAVLSLQPDLIILDETSSQSSEVEQLRGAGIDILAIPTEHSFNNPIAMAEVLQQKLGGSDDRLKEIKTELEQQTTQLKDLLADQESQPKVLFVYARGKGSMMVAGTDTPADAIIGLAGGENAVSDFEGFKALSVEGLVSAQPDVILMFDSGLKSIGGIDGIAEVPGLAQTPAGKNKKVIAMDGLYLLGFTPRVGAATLDLAKQLHNTSTSKQSS